MSRAILSIAAGILLLCSCTNIGPGTVTRDRFDYNSAIADSWKEQTLLNIVKLRYADMPLFVEVASVVSGYTLEGSVNLGGTVSSANTVQGDFLSLGTAGKYTDRPTITYAPITGEQFNQSFMTPIPPKILLFLMQSGWPADMVFPIVVEAINGLRNHKAAGANARMGDPEFYQLISLFQKIQDSGNVGMRVLKDKTNKETTVIFFYREKLPPDLIEVMTALETLLQLRPQSIELKITYGLIPETDSELAIQTRSMMQIMIAMATQIDVPTHHVNDGRTIPSLISSAGAAPTNGRLLRVQTTIDEPENAFVSVKYQNNWFWIDHRDFASKRIFTFLMVLFSLTESGGKTGLPLVTIPAG